MTSEQIKEAHGRLRNMLYWLINQAGEDDFDEKAKAVDNYRRLLERAEKKFLES